MNWISVEERLPKDDQAVLMIDMGSERKHAIPNVGWYEEESNGFYPNSLLSMRAVITQWMPLPELPNG